MSKSGAGVRLPAMDLVWVMPIFLVTATISACGEPQTARGFLHKEARSKSFFGDILKPPPPPPPLSYRGGSGQRVQRQNHDVGYQYPPPPPPPPLPPTANFRLPAPFHKPYNFNFVPPPQPFLTTPSPSVFQKVQNWLFPSSSSQLTSPSAPASIGSHIKKECNPCNLVPWIPVIRYNAPENLNYRESVNQSPGTPAGTYGPPAISPVPAYRPPQPFYGSPKQQTSSLSPPSAAYGPPSPFASYGDASSTYGPPAPSYPPSYSTPSSTYGPPTPQPLVVETFQQQIDRPKDEYRLPKVSYPTGFKNSYGEPLIASYPYNELYPASATAAESSKIKAEVLPDQYSPPNVSVPFSIPAPFTRHPGRGIHTLQPVALPNLSVSPLPPIFNARPFRTNVPSYLTTQSVNSNKDVKVIPSIPLAEFTSSIEYPIKFIQSPILDIDVTRRSNSTKAYRVIPYSETNHDNRHPDASSQASEAHTASANNDIREASFESTGTAAGNDLYNSISSIYNKHNEGSLVLPPNPAQGEIPLNHNPTNNDFRGMADASDENGLRSDEHLQAIDSPVLYLRPNVPHKDFSSLFSVSTTSVPGTSDFEIYDDTPTSVAPPLSTTLDLWNNNQYTQTTDRFQSQDQNDNNPKVVQIIIPYTTGNDPNPGYNQGEDQSNPWMSENENYENQGRKVPSYTESFTGSVSYSDIQYTTPTPPTLQPTEAVTEFHEPPRLTAASILNDLYDVKEPPFDIVELQHNIDGWTEQEFSQHYRTPQKMYHKSKYSKKIPDEYFTTPQPSYQPTTANDLKWSFFDHEGSSSVQHTMKDDIEFNPTQRTAKEYNFIERNKDKRTNHKDLSIDFKKPHIYTAASSFRSASTTIPPWEQIETSISPLTKEKVYVVTSRPWREDGNRSQKWYDGASFESKKTTGLDSDVSASDNLPFHSPRFSNRPSVKPSESVSSRGREDDMHAESSLNLGKDWHQSINALETSDELRQGSTSGSEGDPTPSPTPAMAPTTNPAETIGNTTADSYEEEET